MSLPIRLGLFYGAIFVGTGASSPYMPVWFAHHGLSLPLMARTMTAPPMAIWADSFRLRRTALIFLCGITATAYGLMALPLGFAGWTVVWFAGSAAFSTIPPLIDVLVLNRSQRDGFNFGWHCGLIQSAPGFYYCFSTRAWKQQGIPESMTGVLWGVGVAAEIAFLWFLEPWRRRLGPRNLLILGGIASILRWTAMAVSPPLWLLFPRQGLHFLGYAATFMASLQLAERLSTPRHATPRPSSRSARRFPAGC